jgi:hypothetical protein
MIPNAGRFDVFAAPEQPESVATIPDALDSPTSSQSANRDLFIGELSSTETGSMVTPTRAIYERCLEGLQLVYAEVSADDSWRKLVLLMKIWSYSLFEKPMVLDTILTVVENEERINEDLRRAVIGVLADVALIEGK